MDFLDQLKTYVEGLSFTPPAIQIGLYSENGNSMAIRPVPSNIDTRFMEKTKIYPFQFQVLVHHKENSFAYKIINQLTNELDNLPNGAITSNDGSFVFVSLHCTTTPNFVQKTSYGVLWTAVFTAELYV